MTGHALLVAITLGMASAAVAQSDPLPGDVGATNEAQPAAVVDATPESAASEPPPAADEPNDAVPAEAAPAPAVPRVLVLELKGLKTDADSVAFMTSRVYSAVARIEGVEAVNAADLQRMMELEGERQAVGCDTTSCLGEIAGAMGARYVLFGEISAFGGHHFLTLSLFDSVQARAVGTEERRAREAIRLVDTVDDQVRTVLGDLAKDDGGRAAADVGGAAPPTPPTPPTPPPSPPAPAPEPPSAATGYTVLDARSAPPAPEPEPVEPEPTLAQVTPAPEPGDEPPPLGAASAGAPPADEGGVSFLLIGGAAAAAVSALVVVAGGVGSVGAWYLTGLRGSVPLTVRQGSQVGMWGAAGAAALGVLGLGAGAVVAGVGAVVE